MADNYLEKKYEDYQLRKQKWLQKKSKGTINKIPNRQICKPEDEAL